MLTLGMAPAAVLAALSPFLLAAAFPLLAGTAVAWYVVKLFRPVAERTLLGLERALDYLERGGVKPAHQLPPRGGGLLESLAGEIRKAITASSERPKLK